MYKIFRGFHLVETYQELKKAKRLAEKRIVSRGIKRGRKLNCVSEGNK